MRDRSGRSGRRRGSQKPGTACGPDGLTPCARATPAGNDRTSHAPISTPAMNKVARFSFSNPSLTAGTIVGCIADGFRVDGLIDHPAPDARAVCAAATPHGPGLRRLARPHFRPVASEIAFEVARGFFRLPLQVE